MSYTPTDWKNGDIITAEKLNNMETGIVGSGEGNSLIITVSGLADRDNPTTTPVVNKTPDEVYDAISSGKSILIRTEQNSNIIFYSKNCSCGIVAYDDEPQKFVSLSDMGMAIGPYTSIIQQVLYGVAGADGYWSSSYDEQQVVTSQ